MKKILAVLVGAMFLTLFGVFSLVHANPLQGIAPVQTNAATSTPNYLTPGTATTTLTFDAYAQGTPLFVDRAVVLLQYVASSTSSVLLTKLQYSQDGIDWYDDDLNFSTTTAAQNIGTSNSYTWTAAGTATSSKALLIQTPTRYVRAQFSDTGAGLGIWAQIVPSRQRSE